ncbi:PLP-dependent transferase [Gallaecimonas kandeliae]|uniref:PLP-dependent transferase n=1 Tax=Gallaecimonas kandeliae TaxID=3029055 RepID=UPI003AF3280B
MGQLHKLRGGGRAGACCHGMTHAAMSVDARAAAGINDGLLRFSVGIEGAEDLIADLAQAWPALRGE